MLGEYPGDTITVHYNEDIFVGYRYFDTYKVEPQFAFGHGLSYTTFSYSNMNVTTGTASATVALTVTNTGKKAGAETVQIYVKDDVCTLKRPEKELKGFQKVWLQPGESRKITITLDKEAFQYYDNIAGQWVFEPGAFTIIAASSAKDIRAVKKIELK